MTLVRLKPAQWTVFGCEQRVHPLVAGRRLGKTFLALNRTYLLGAGIRSAKTLGKHFRADLDRGRLEANSDVAPTL